MGRDELRGATVDAIDRLLTVPSRDPASASAAHACLLTAETLGTWWLPLLDTPEYGAPSE